MKKRRTEGLNNSSGLQSPQGRYAPRQWMNYIMNLTYTYNPSTNPWGEIYNADKHNMLIPYLSWEKSTMKFS